MKFEEFLSLCKIKVKSENLSEEDRSAIDKAKDYFSKGDPILLDSWLTKNRSVFTL